MKGIGTSVTGTTIVGCSAVWFSLQGTLGVLIAINRTGFMSILGWFLFVLSTLLVFSIPRWPLHRLAWGMSDRVFLLAFSAIIIVYLLEITSMAGLW